MEKSEFFENSLVLRRLREDPNLQHFAHKDDFPHAFHPDVRKAEGRKGFNFIRDYPKTGQELFYDKENKIMKAAVFFSLMTEGPPGCVHGGSIAAEIDQLCGDFVHRAVGLKCVTLNLNVDYKKLIKLDTTVLAVMQLEKKEEKKVWATGKLYGENGELHVESRGLFYFQKEPMNYEAASEIARKRTLQETIDAVKANSKL